MLSILPPKYIPNPTHFHLYHDGPNLLHHDPSDGLDQSLTGLPAATRFTSDPPFTLHSIWSHPFKPYKPDHTVTRSTLISQLVPKLIYRLNLISSKIPVDLFFLF